MSVVYCITNSINDKKYIGRTNNLKRRIVQHKNDSLNENCPLKYNTPFAHAIRKYGWENFSTSILVENDDENKINELEIYYIEKFNTYGENRYNASKGGEFGYSGRIYESKIDKDLANIINDLKNNISIKKIAEKYNISYSYVSDINNGTRLRQENETYPLQLSREKQILLLYPQIIDELKNSILSMAKIAQKYGIHKDTVSKINLGKTQQAHLFNNVFPIRKK